MPKTAGQAALDELIRRALTPVLKPAGYKKTAHTFRRAHADCVQVVNVQASQFGDAHHVRFTINLGVFYPRVRALTDDKLPSGAGPKEYECQLRKRIGALSEGRDIWWDINGGELLDETAARVETALRDHGLPWLERMAIFENARSAAANRAAFDLAAADIQR